MGIRVIHGGSSAQGVLAAGLGIGAGLGARASRKEEEQQQRKKFELDQGFAALRLKDLTNQMRVSEEEEAALDAFGRQWFDSTMAEGLRARGVDEDSIVQMGESFSNLPYAERKLVMEQAEQERALERKARRGAHMNAMVLRALESSEEQDEELRQISPSQANELATKYELWAAGAIDDEEMGQGLVEAIAATEAARSKAKTATETVAGINAEIVAVADKGEREELDARFQAEMRLLDLASEAANERGADEGVSYQMIERAWERAKSGMPLGGGGFEVPTSGAPTLRGGPPMPSAGMTPEDILSHGLPPVEPAAPAADPAADPADLEREMTLRMLAEEDSEGRRPDPSVQSGLPIATTPFLRPTPVKRPKARAWKKVGPDEREDLAKQMLEFLTTSDELKAAESDPKRHESILRRFVRDHLGLHSNDPNLDALMKATEELSEKIKRELRIKELGQIGQKKDD